MPASMAERLKARLVLDPETGCLLWTGARHHAGYGLIMDGPWTRRVHIVAWELENGPVPDGLVLDHVYDRGCRHRHCANVAHLEPVTRMENMRRGIAAKRAHG